MRALWLFLVLTGFGQTEELVRTLDIWGASSSAGQIVPLYDKGYLIYLHRPNRLEVFRPDGQRAFNLDLPCPGTGTCSAGAVTVDSRGNTAVSIASLTEKGK